MLELIAIAAALAGGFAAGIWDLKTTDIPDEVPAVMAALGLFLWYAFGLTAGNWQPFIVSAVAGTAAFAIGWALYKLGQWGGGDAALIAGTFYLLADMGLIADYMLNFFIVALAYLIVYSIALGLLHPEIFSYARGSLKQRTNAVMLAVLIAAGGLAAAGFGIAGGNLSLALQAFLAVVGISIFYVYAKAVEKKLFRRAIPASKLKVGDVLASSKQWIGISAKEIRELKRKHRTVEIKEGVRFGLVFPLTLVVTLLFGNVLFWLVGLV